MTPALAQRPHAASTGPSRESERAVDRARLGEAPRSVSSPRATTKRKPPRACGCGVNPTSVAGPAGGSRTAHTPQCGIPTTEPAVRAEPGSRAWRQPGQVVLAGVGDDDLAGRVVDGLDLVVDGGAAESLGRQHRDRRHDVAGAGERPAGARQPAEGPARRDADRLAETELRNVAVERAAVQAVRIDDRLERERRPQGAVEVVGEWLLLERPVAPHVRLEGADVARRRPPGSASTTSSGSTATSSMPVAARRASSSTSTWA